MTIKKTIILEIRGEEYYTAVGLHTVFTEAGLNTRAIRWIDVIDDELYVCTDKIYPIKGITRDDIWICPLDDECASWEEATVTA